MFVLRTPCLQVRLALEMMFEGTQGAGDLGRVDATTDQEGQVLRIGDAVTLTFQMAATGTSGGRVILEWCGGSDTDMVADAVVAVVLQSAGEPPGLPAIEVQRHKALQSGDVDAADAAELAIITALLGAQFGPARVDADQVRRPSHCTARATHPLTRAGKGAGSCVCGGERSVGRGQPEERQGAVRQCRAAGASEEGAWPHARSPAALRHRRPCLAAAGAVDTENGTAVLLCLQCFTLLLPIVAVTRLRPTQQAMRPHPAIAAPLYIGPSSWPQDGRGSVYSMPSAMMAGMYPKWTAVCGKGVDVEWL